MNYTIGQRIQTHPATDQWMMGDRYGEVVKIGRKYIHVKMDKTGKILKFLPRYLQEVNDYSRIESVRIIDGKL